MKKLLLGCIAAVAALMALSGCDQDKVGIQRTQLSYVF